LKRRKKAQVQVIIFDRKVFKNKKQISVWLIKKGYKKKYILKKETCYEAKQRNKYRFVKRTLLCEKDSKGVTITKGKLR